MNSQNAIDISGIYDPKEEHHIVSSIPYLNKLYITLPT